MNRLQIVQRVRALTRDFSNSIFRETDIIDFINEGINRFKQVIPELQTTPQLLANENQPHPIPEQYHHLLALYSASRCFTQDERHYQATTLMNEFEVKVEELQEKMDNGEIIIIDPETNQPIVMEYNAVDYVDLKPYWGVGD